MTKIKIIKPPIGSEIEFAMKDRLVFHCKEVFSLILEAEVRNYLITNSSRTPNGKRLVIRNGYSQPRKFDMFFGSFELRIPRIRDSRKSSRFSSVFVSPYSKENDKIERQLFPAIVKAFSENEYEHDLLNFLTPKSLVKPVPFTKDILDELHQYFSEWIKKFKLHSGDTIWIKGLHPWRNSGTSASPQLLMILKKSSENGFEPIVMKVGSNQKKEDWLELFKNFQPKENKNLTIYLEPQFKGLIEGIIESNKFEFTVQQKWYLYQILKLIEKPVAAKNSTQNVENDLSKIFKEINK